MLTKGDLVKIKQDAFLYPAGLEPWHVKRLKDPEFGVVVDRASDEDTKVLLESQLWIVNNKCIQLIGESDVRKIKQDK